MSQISNRKSPFASSTGTYSESTPLNEVDSMLILPEERVDTFRDFSEPTEHKPLLPSLQNNIDTDNKHMLVCSYGMHLIQNRKPTMRIINYFKQYHTTSAVCAPTHSALSLGLIQCIAEGYHLQYPKTGSPS